MKAEHAYLVGMAAPEDLRVMRQELAKEHEAPPAVRCDHKFIDSTRCLKCGFDPAGGR
jgi:sRNA-binding carbon storage regulator CsrA